MAEACWDECAVPPAGVRCCRGVPMIDVGVTFGLAGIMSAGARRKVHALASITHAEGSRDHDVPVDVAGRVRLKPATDVCRHRPIGRPSWSVSAWRSSERSTRISSMSSRITFAR